MPKIQDHPASLLLLEGSDGFHVIQALCRRFNIPIRNLENQNGGTFSAIDCKGIDALLEQISVRFKSSPLLTTIGVIIDADDDLRSRWQSLKAIAESLGFVPPEVLPQSGIILNNGNKRLGVWIMPNNNLNGMLEDFISFLTPQNDQLLPLVNSTLQSIEQQNLNKYLPIHKPKAIIHTWLAWQEEPGTPLGLSITKRYPSVEPEICGRLMAWITGLFVEIHDNY